MAVSSINAVAGFLSVLLCVPSAAMRVLTVIDDNPIPPRNSCLVRPNGAYRDLDRKIFRDRRTADKLQILGQAIDRRLFLVPKLDPEQAGQMDAAETGAVSTTNELHNGRAPWGCRSKAERKRSCPKLKVWRHPSSESTDTSAECRNYRRPRPSSSSSSSLPDRRAGSR